jgi:ABC-type branched-subunit amino acid transport system permease subunit
MVVLGGLGSISGAALAAVILTLLTQVLQDPTSASIWPWGVVGGALVATLGAFGARHRRWAPPVTVTGLLVTWQVLRWLHMQNRINLNDYRMVIYSLALIVMIIARPSGFFGIQEIWDYLPRSWQFWHADAGKVTV